jgi:hypothetical protein
VLEVHSVSTKKDEKTKEKKEREEENASESDWMHLSQK